LHRLHAGSPLGRYLAGPLEPEPAAGSGGNGEAHGTMMWPPDVAPPELVDPDPADPVLPPADPVLPLAAPVLPLADPVLPLADPVLPLADPVDPVEGATAPGATGPGAPIDGGWLGWSGAPGVASTEKVSRSVAITRPEESKAVRVPGEAGEIADDDADPVVGAARATQPSTGFMLSVPPPVKVARTSATPWPVAAMATTVGAPSEVPMTWGRTALRASL
jgi:hypothetical protein